MGKLTEPCASCDDSGYAEFVSGGFWTGENVRTRYEICDCPCGDDVRRETLARTKNTPDSQGGGA